MVIPYRIYRHFKGGMYLVLSVALNEETLESTVVYMSLNGDGKVWTRSQIDFESLVPEGKNNPTGQQKRFELVNDIRSTLSLCTTENLIKELKGRADSPLNDLDIEGFNDKVALVDYIVGTLVEDPSSEFTYVSPTVSVDSLEEAKSFVTNYPHRCNSRTKIFKRVFVEVESFD